MVNTRDYSNTNIPLEPFASTPNTHLWHFDDNLSSDSGIELTFTGDAHFDNKNLFWMQNQKGKAIRVKNHGDGVKASIPIADLLEGQSLDDLNSVTIEALIYPEELPPQEYLVKIIKFEQSWESQLKLVRFKWEDVLKTRLSKEILGEDGDLS